MADFSLTPIQALRLAIGDPDGFLETMRGFQRFNVGRHRGAGIGNPVAFFGDLAALKMVKDMTPNCVNEPVFKSELRKITKPTQGFTADSFGIDRNGVFNDFGNIVSGQTTRRDTYQISDPITTSFVVNMSEMNDMHWDKDTPLETRFQLLMANGYFEGLKRLSDRYDEIVTNYILANVSQTAVSTYAASAEANAFAVPATAFTAATEFDFYTNMMNIAELNRFYTNGGKKVYLLSSTNERVSRMKTGSYGQYNQFMTGNVVNDIHFDFRNSLRLNAAFTPVDERGTSLMIFDGGLGCAEWVAPNFWFEGMQSSADYDFASISADMSLLSPTAASAFPNIQVGIATKRGVVDNSGGTWSENHYDRVIEVEMGIRPVVFSALSDRPNDTPIIKHNFLV